MVRSMKEGMEAIGYGRKLTDEILLTVLVEVDSFVNARPFTYMPQEPGKCEKLNPKPLKMPTDLGIGGIRSISRQ